MSAEPKLDNRLEENQITKDELTHSINEAILSGNDKLLKKIITHIHIADLADYISFADYDQRKKIITLLNDKIDPEILLEFEEEVVKSLIEIMSIKKFAVLVDKLNSDDAVEFLDDLNNEDEKNEILEHLPSAKQKTLRQGLSYPKNSAGILMHGDYVAVRDNKTIGEVLDYLEENTSLPEDYDEIYVVDSKGRPVGNLRLSKILQSKKFQNISNVMNEDIQLINVMLDQEEVSYIFKHYDLISAPVVNKFGKLVGVIDVDQIIDVIEEEAEEDIMRMGGINNITDIYSAYFKTAVQRFPWLFVNLIMACATSLIIAHFASEIQQIVVLAAIMPIVASMGGNAGTQTVTVAVRAIANKDITTLNIWRVINKEIIACALNGLLLGILGGFILLMLYQDVNISSIFVMAVTINFTLAGLWGSMIPIVLNRMGFDPAISSSVFLTFLTDFLGFFIFLWLASILLT